MLWTSWKQRSGMRSNTQKVGSTVFSRRRGCPARDLLQPLLELGTFVRRGSMQGPASKSVACIYPVTSFHHDFICWLGTEHQFPSGWQSHRVGKVWVSRSLHGGKSSASQDVLSSWHIGVCYSSKQYPHTPVSSYALEFCKAMDSSLILASVCGKIFDCGLGAENTNGKKKQMLARVPAPPGLTVY